MGLLCCIAAYKQLCCLSESIDNPCESGHCMHVEVLGFTFNICITAPLPCCQSYPNLSEMPQSY